MHAEAPTAPASGRRSNVGSRWLTIALLVAVLALVGFAAFNFVRFWGHERLAGRVIETGAGYIVIENQEAIAIRIILGNDTELRAGRTLVGLPSLQGGEFVMVFGARRNGDIAATRIVILEGDPRLPAGKSLIPR
ncbi:hypothetical protein C4552_03445 [Candidatus Parcubacteria bacterium]|nr:MAG: hypothetical protein C4552_03445 [Candidatus Parcubacteria bacterium]